MYLWVQIGVYYFYVVWIWFGMVDDLEIVLEDWWNVFVVFLVYVVDCFGIDQFFVYQGGDVQFGLCEYVIYCIGCGCVVC